MSSIDLSIFSYFVINIMMMDAKNRSEIAHIIEGRLQPMTKPVSLKLDLFFVITRLRSMSYRPTVFYAEWESNWNGVCSDHCILLLRRHKAAGFSSSRKLLQLSMAHEMFRVLVARELLARKRTHISLTIQMNALPILIV